MEKDELMKAIQKLEEKEKRNEQAMDAVQNDHIKAVEEMQNNFNEELDFKNAEIEKLRRGN